jgi:hypothetical protein
VTSPDPDPRVTKRRVTMRSVQLGADGALQYRQAVDHVRPDLLDAYLAEYGPRWQHVEVSDEPDAGPGGYDGATYVPAELDHPLAHTYFPATDCVGCTHAPAGALVVEGSDV